MTLEVTICLCLSVQDITNQQFIPVTAHLLQYLTHLCKFTHSNSWWWCLCLLPHRELEATGAILFPVAPTSAPTLVEDSTEGFFFCGLLHRLAPSTLGGSWPFLMLSHSLSCCSGETARQFLMCAPHAGPSDSLLKPDQAPSVTHSPTHGRQDKDGAMSSSCTHTVS